MLVLEELKRRLYLLEIDIDAVAMKKGPGKCISGGWVMVLRDKNYIENRYRKPH